MPQPQPARNKFVAGILSLFFGGFGIHKFYLGLQGQGILYLCFFWTGIPQIIGWIEAIYLFSLSDQAFNEKYNADRPPSPPSSRGTDSPFDLLSQISQISSIDQLEKLHKEGKISTEQYLSLKEKFMENYGK